MAGFDAGTADPKTVGSGVAKAGLKTVGSGVATADPLATDSDIVRASPTMAGLGVASVTVAREVVVATTSSGDSCSADLSAELYDFDPDFDPMDEILVVGSNHCSY